MASNEIPAGTPDPIDCTIAPAGAMLRYDRLGNAHDRRALLERTGKRNRLNAYGGRFRFIAPPPDVSADAIAHRHAGGDHRFDAAKAWTIAGPYDGTGACGLRASVSQTTRP